MDNLQQRTGFMPGLFGRKKRAERMQSGSSTTEKMTPKKNPIADRIPDTIRNHFVAMAGEFVGTFLFLFFAFAGTQVANTQAAPTSPGGAAPAGPNPQQLMYIALSFGFSLAVNAWVFYRVSGGLFNPAVTLGLCLIGAVPFGRGVLVFIAQLLGGLASSAVVSALLPGPLAVNTTLAGGTSAAQGVFIEMFLTAQLVFTIIMLAAEKHKGTFLAPIGIGLALFIAELAGVYYTGGSLNPTRSFGPAVITRTFPSEHWIYWVGPFLGAIIAAGFYWFIKTFEYQTANPGQDFDDLEDKYHDPSTGTGRPAVQAEALAEKTGSSTRPRSDDRSRDRSRSRRSRQQSYNTNNNIDLTRAPTARGYDNPAPSSQPQYGGRNDVATYVSQQNTNYMPARDYNEGRAYYEPPMSHNTGGRGYEIRHSGVQRY